MTTRCCCSFRIPPQGSQGQEKGREKEQKGDSPRANEMAEAIADEIVEDFKEQWSEAMKNLDTADAAFDDLGVRP